MASPSEKSGPNFKVVIVGGSVAGLTLANMLELHGIDFVVLEAHAQIAPQLGASIALFSNGQRIMDQLGLYDKVSSLVPESLVINHYLSEPEGSQVLSLEYLGLHLERRMGYKSLFIERQQLLQILYENLKNKDKVHAGKRIARIITAKSRVEVVTAEGESFTGDLLVGADGIRSTIRQEMWRLAADEDKSKYNNAANPFPPDEMSRVSCDYKCIFGISPPMQAGFPSGSSYMTFGKGYAYLIAVGPEDKIYWFLFVHLGTKVYGKDIPRFTKEDETKLAAEHFRDKFGSGITFGDLYKGKTFSTLVALEDYVFERWHYQRIITIGDSAHKFNPLGGQGGQSAMESGATLVNLLVSKLNTRPVNTRLSLTDIEDILASTQVQRMDRANELEARSHEQQRFQALETPFHRLMAYYIFPSLGTEAGLNLGIIASVIDGVRLEGVPVPQRQRVVPFTDALPAKPFRGRAVTWLSKAFAVGVFGSLFYMATRELLGVDLSMGTDLAAAVAGFAPMINNVLGIQGVYFLGELVSTYAIWTIEGWRGGSRISLISWPSVWGLASHPLGIGGLSPLYYLAHTATSSSPAYARASGRIVDEEAAQAILPSVLLGYVLPTALILLPTVSARAKIFGSVGFTLSSVAIGLSVTAISSSLRRSRQKQRLQQTGGDVMAAKKLDLEEWYMQKDVRPLRRVYMVVFYLSAMAHLGSLAYMYRADMPVIPSLFGELFGDVTIKRFFQWDMHLHHAATLTHNLYTVFEMRRLGYVTTGRAVTAALGVLVGQVMVGNGATYAALWHWREGVIYGLAK